MLLSKHNGTEMFIAAFVIKTSVCKQPKYLPKVEWITKLWETRTREYNTAMKVTELQPHKTAEMSLLMLNERSQMLKMHIVSFYFYKLQTILMYDFKSQDIG